MQNPGVCRVFVNQVEVGALPEQDYHNLVAEAKREVKGDRRLYLAQTVNLLGCIIRSAKITLFTIPMLLFLGVATGILFAPNVMADTVTALRQASSVEVIAAMRTIVLTFSAAAVLALALGAALTGYEFGYFNQFQSAISERISLRIRAIMEVAADGDVEVHIEKVSVREGE